MGRIRYRSSGTQESWGWPGTRRLDDAPAMPRSELRGTCPASSKPAAGLRVRETAGAACAVPFDARTMMTARGTAFRGVKRERV